MTLTIALDLPDPMVQQIEILAHQQQRSIADIVRQWVLKELPIIPALPVNFQAELDALANLSSEVLWILARSTLSQQDQEELATLNSKSKQRKLTKKEAKRQEELLSAYDRNMVRRAEAAHLLQRRGYDISSPSILQVA